MPTSTVPGDLMSRLCAIPFTTDVPGSGGGLGALSAGPGELTVTGAVRFLLVDLHPHRRGRTASTTARWLRRGLVGTLVGLGVGVTALALNLPGRPRRRTATPRPGRRPSPPSSTPTSCRRSCARSTSARRPPSLRPGGTP